MTEIKTLTTMIQNQRICNASTFIGYESRIEGRFVASFESLWMLCFERLKNFKISNDQIIQLNELREIAYKASYGATQNPDLAALVSDDFELIGKAASVSADLPWLNGLWLAYLNGTFPSGEIEEHDGPLSALINCGRKGDGNQNGKR